MNPNSHVADVQCDSLTTALVCTLAWKNKDAAPTQWVTPIMADARGTTFGDIIINPEGVAFSVQKSGEFKRVDCPTHGIEPNEEVVPLKEQFQMLLAELQTDYEAARLRDAGQDYEKFLAEAQTRALSRMQGKDGGYER